MSVIRGWHLCSVQGCYHHISRQILLVSMFHHHWGTAVAGSMLNPGYIYCVHNETALIARIMGQTWGPTGADRTQVGPMLAPWTLLSGWWLVPLSSLAPSAVGVYHYHYQINIFFITFALHFGVEISSIKMACCPWKINKIIKFWLLTSWWWYYNANAWEVSVNHMWCMMTSPLIASQLSAVLFGNGSNGSRTLKFYR